MKSKAFYPLSFYAHMFRSGQYSPNQPLHHSTSYPYDTSVPAEQVAKNGFAKGWKKIHPPKNPKTIPFSHITGEDNNYNV
jgi:hypothetical protein